MGFDLVAFSGGKGLRGPQSAGLLLGNKEIIKAARLHTPPRGFNIGRGMKVNKEEVLGILVALELYLVICSYMILDRNVLSRILLQLMAHQN